MAARIEFDAADGTKGAGLLGLPAGDDRVGTVVLLHEWWGLNGHIATLVDRLAAAGFVALAPDLYEAQVATTPEDAMALMNAMSWSTALGTIAGATGYLRAHPRSNGNVGVTGFCMGGAGAFVVAARVPGLSAAVPFYGLAPAAYVDWETAETPPIQAHFSTRDAFAPVSRAEDVQATLQARGRTMELHRYDADHAFVNDTRPDVHDPAAAALAWSRMIAFLHAHLDG